MPNDAPSLRETIEAAMTSSTEAPEPVETTSTAAPAEVETASTAPQETTPGERQRDEKGRFAPKAGEEEAAAAPKGAEKAKVGAVAAAEAKASGVTPQTPPAKVEPVKPPKIPQSWKATQRELAAKLPQEFHPLLEEAYRRDVETNKAMQEAAQVRQFAGQIQQSLAPYAPIAAANGTDVMTWAGSALQTVAALYSGTPQQKAMVIAQAIALSGVDVEAVNAAMQGQQGATTAMRPPPPVDVNAAVEKAIAQRLQAVEVQKADADASDFIASEPEFLTDVWQDMVQLIQVAEARGQKMTYPQAYDKACRMNEDVSKLVEGRKATEVAKAKASTVPKARAAAMSIKASPAEPVHGGKSERRTLRETIEAAVEAERT